MFRCSSTWCMYVRLCSLAVTKSSMTNISRGPRSQLSAIHGPPTDSLISRSSLQIREGPRSGDTASTRALRGRDMKWSIFFIHLYVVCRWNFYFFPFMSICEGVGVVHTYYWNSWFLHFDRILLTSRKRHQQYSNVEPLERHLDVNAQRLIEKLPFRGKLPLVSDAGKQ